MSFLPVLRAPAPEALNTWLFEQKGTQPEFLSAISQYGALCRNSLMAMDMITGQIAGREVAKVESLLKAVTSVFATGLLIGREQNNREDNILPVPTPQEFDRWLMEDVIHRWFVDATGYRDTLQDCPWTQGLIQLTAETLHGSEEEMDQIYASLWNSLAFGVALGHVWNCPSVSANPSPQPPTARVFDHWIEVQVKLEELNERDLYSAMMIQSDAAQSAIQHLVDKPSNDNLYRLLGLGFELGRLWERR